MVWLEVVGRDSSAVITTRYGLGGPGIESRRGEIFRIRPDRPWGPPSLLYNRYRIFPGGKATGAWRWPSSAEVKERVELYIYLLPLWAFVACFRVNISFTFISLTRSVPSDYWNLFFTFSESFGLLALCCAQCSLYAVVELLMRQAGKVGGFAARSLVRAGTHVSMLNRGTEFNSYYCHLLGLYFRMTWCQT